MPGLCRVAKLCDRAVRHGWASCSGTLREDAKGLEQVLTKQKSGDMTDRVPTPIVRWNSCENTHICFS